MKETTISVTLAARRFSDCINSVRYHGASFLLEKNGVPVARIIPAQSNVGPAIEQLAATLRQTRKAPEASQDKALSDESGATSGAPAPSKEPVKQPKRPTLNW
jgi:antitoxin (DNA-binding transcriptional repressor) of toxin-antitoxin stability system